MEPLTRDERRTALLAVALTILPVALDLCHGRPERRMFSLLAADTFYYLTVARHVVVDGIVSFDGEHPTNGFHPLWQAITVVVAFLVHAFRANEAWIPGLSVVLGLALVGAASWFSCLACKLAVGFLPEVVLLLPLGASTVLQDAALYSGWRTLGRASTTLWGAVNGMESAAVLAAFAVCAWAHFRAPRTRAGALGFGVALAALTFARLDHVFFALFLGGSLLAGPTAERRFAAIALAVLSGLVGVYLALNRFYCGMFLPISGEIKSTFPHVATTNGSLLASLVLSPRRVPWTHAHRGLQMLLPALVALGVVRVLARDATRPSPDGVSAPRRFLGATALGVLTLAAYDFLYVPRTTQGHWYFPVSSAFVSMAALAAWVRFVPGGRAPPVRASGIRQAIACSLVIAGYLLVASIGTDEGLAAFYFDEAPKIRDFYRGKTVKMVEFDDGIVTFATGIPAMSGLGLTLDRAAVEESGGFAAHRTGKARIMDLGVRRGYDRFTVVGYPHGKVTPKSSSSQIRTAFIGQIAGQLEGCDLALDYVSVPTNFAIVRASCRPPRRK
ncbi:MAG TPA: hypothetical protein VHE30_25450 [Polyangiaceae bacterium]|nr:hypothetical protein [Polyangiaceae bacterium]